MKTSIKPFSCNSVVIVYDDPMFEERRTREFWIPLSGGYVREYSVNGRDDRQVCEMLSSGGNTLRADNPAQLLAIIRREYRAMRRAEKKED